MPEENGLTFAQELRSAKETEDLPIIIISSKKLTPEEHLLLERHQLTYINKERDDNEDQRVKIERVLLNLGLNDLHQTEQPS